MDNVQNKKIGSEYVHIQNCELIKIGSKICLISN